MAREGHSSCRRPRSATPPAASSDTVAERMRALRRRDTQPELVLRRELHRRGMRFRVDSPVLPRGRRADIMFRRQRVAVFVDGCFWHACPEHASWPKANAAWWREKIEGNQRRDRDTDARLLEAGWIVVRVWEHEGVAAAANQIEAVVARQRSEQPHGGVR